MSPLGNAFAQFVALPGRFRRFVEEFPTRIVQLWRRRSLGHMAMTVNFVATVIAATIFLALFYAHFKVVLQPGPQEFNEPAIWHATWLLDHGRNPYSIEELPGSAYCLGPLYNYVVMAFKPIFGIDYPAHRMVVLIFLMGSLWLLLQAMLKAGAGLGIAALSVTFYYWMSLKNIEITARPDTLALFFFLLSILVPWNRGYTRGATIFGLLCAVVAFNAKSYLVAGGCATLLAHFMVRDKAEACWLGVGFFTLLGLTFALSCYLFPYFYIETIIIQRGGAAVNDRDDISLMHTQMLFERAWPYLLLSGYGIAAWLWRRRRQRRERAQSGRGAPKAAAGDARFMALGSALVLFTAVVYFYMGRNAGAYFTYHLHLIFPLLLILAAYAVDRPWIRTAFGLLLIGFFWASVDLPQVDDSTVPYRRLERLVMDTHSEVLGIACVTDVFERDNRRVLHNGNTMFIGFAFIDDRALHDPMVGALATKFDAAQAEVTAKVEARAYGMVLTEFDEPYFCPAEILKKNYDKVEQVDYYTFFGHSPVRVWRPKPRLAEPESASTP